MLIGVIADDFTGASDIANTLAKGIAPEGGLKTAQFSGVPDSAAPNEIDAGVIALKSRSALLVEAVSQSVAALRWLRAQGCEQIVFKYCSTFDSTKAGNIGPVAEALANEIGTDRVVFCPSFPAAGRTVYQGHLFVGDKPLHESGMQDHPITPMSDPDIRRWLSYQTREQIAHLPHEVVRARSGAIRRALATATGRFIVADAVDNADLLSLGEALFDAPLVTGGSGIALGLPRNFIQQGKADAQSVSLAPVHGPEAILAGSCSGATLRQIELHAASHPALAIDVAAVMEGAVTPLALVDFFKEHVGRAPAAYSSRTPNEIRELQSRFGREEIAKRLDTLFASTAVALVEAGYQRLVIAGGETSGAVSQAVADALQSPAMTVGPEIDPGVPVLLLGPEKSVALALKSGNFGADDFFAKALRVMSDAHET